MSLPLSFGNTRVKLNERAIAQVAENRAVQEGTLDLAAEISAEVKARTSGSRRLFQYGRKMEYENTETGARAGTSWGPAVPVEYGTVSTPPLRILLGAAEATGARVETGGR